MVTTQSRQKSYADLRRRHVEFEVGGHVFLCVTPRKGIVVKSFGMKGKLSPRYNGPFEILDRVDTPHVLSYKTLGLQEDLSFDERPVKILNRKDNVLRNKTISLVKMMWRNNVVEEATWELELDILQQYPELFQ
ncbi:uncharacterized protein LOC133791911 [Humulus lupulus]|uniref:uncharacterized protein LOC133791911 n=1 Tax=Humulus lupulus TaxID=3486 RepID=UPI002B401143|nr:uncharacterized protein LOC133791911 [Humulus lupulus]